MRKRYAITMDEETHRKLTVEAVHQGRSVGDLIRDLVEGPKIVNLGPNVTKQEVDRVKNLWLEESVDDIAKKAIEPEQVKTTNGKLSKGLGTIPGQDPPRPLPGTLERDNVNAIVDRGIGFSRPAPKPGKTGAKK